MTEYRNPLPTVDIIIEIDNQIVMVRRANPPYGLALPGGFVEEGELLEQSAIREAREETGLDVDLYSLFYAYSHPHRDERKHTISVVYLARSSGFPIAGSDAKEAILVDPTSIKETIAFDHGRIIEDYVNYKLNGRFPSPQLILSRLPGF